MKSTKFFQLHSDDAVPPEYTFELLQDPVRSKIIFEIILNGEVTADQIVEATEKSRSTIAHHLKKLVENGILDVFMHPTGKTKFYRITKNIERLMYSFDKEKFSKGTLEEQSAFLIELGNMFSLVSHIYANIHSDQMKLYQANQPFDKISIDEKEEITFTINKKEITMPYLTFFITGKEQAEFIREELRDLMKKFGKKFGDMPDVETTLQAKTKYIVNMQILTFLHKNDLK